MSEHWLQSGRSSGFLMVWKQQLGRDHGTGTEVNTDCDRVIEQMVHEVYIALVLGCKMEIPGKRKV